VKSSRLAALAVSTEPAIRAQLSRPGWRGIQAGGPILRAGPLRLAQRLPTSFFQGWRLTAAARCTPKKLFFGEAGVALERGSAPGYLCWLICFGVSPSRFQRQPAARALPSLGPDQRAARRTEAAGCCAGAACLISCAGACVASAPNRPQRHRLPRRRGGGWLRVW